MAIYTHNMCFICVFIEKLRFVLNEENILDRFYFIAYLYINRNYFPKR